MYSFRIAINNHMSKIAMTAFVYSAVNIATHCYDKTSNDSRDGEGVGYGSKDQHTCKDEN